MLYFFVEKNPHTSIPLSILTPPKTRCHYQAKSLVSLRGHKWPRNDTRTGLPRNEAGSGIYLNSGVDIEKNA